MEKKLSLSVCFQLGRALRYSDADVFLTLYDSLLCDGRVEQDQQLLAVKEWSRQISELNHDDFSLLHTAATLSGPLSTQDVSIATGVEGAVCQQLCSLLEKLRSVEATTSDSGAVSDYSENADCKSYSLTSLDLEETESYQHSKATLGVNNTGHSPLEGEKFTNTATEVSIEIQGKLTQRKEEQLPATENTFCEPESEQPSSVTVDCDKSGDQVSDSTKKNPGEQLVKVAKETIEIKRETVSDEQFSIRRKTRRHCGRGYNNWRRSCGYYDNSRSRNSHHDNSRNRSRQQTSSLRDPKQSSFNHEEVAAFLWNRWKSVEKASHHDSLSHNKS